MEGTEKGFWKNIMLPAIGTGGVSTAFNLLTMAVQNKFNSDQAHIARNWNQQMDNTKYQRTVADMKAAGVNPALAMDGGVTTQATSNAVAQGASPAYTNLGAIASMAQAISAARLSDAQAENIKEDTNKKRAEIGKLVEETIGFLSEVRLSDKPITLENGMVIYNHMAATNVYDKSWGRKYKVKQEDICDYLKMWRDKAGYTTKKVDDHFGYKYTAGHWFRKDNNSGSIPKPEDWWELKKLLGFDDKYDKEVTTLIEKPVVFEQAAVVAERGKL